MHDVIQEWEPVVTKGVIVRLDKEGHIPDSQADGYVALLTLW